MNSAARQSGTEKQNSATGLAEQSFEALYDQHKRRVYSLCLRMLGNSTDAEDLTQEVFLQVYRKLDSFRGESSFSTWLHRLTVNTVLMHFRRQRSRQEEAMEDEDLQRIIQSKSTSGSPNERSLINRIALNDAIAQLPSGYRKVLLLHDVEGYEHDEIGRQLGITGGTTKSQLHKARAKLRHLLRKPPRPGTKERTKRRRNHLDLIDAGLSGTGASSLSPAAS
ncbi:MAG: RNA polymerase sigma factor [Acidobacteria bacterium]|nr:RNA polymerase sigma factor [Acidobacteriota bacterium]